MMRLPINRILLAVAVLVLTIVVVGLFLTRTSHLGPQQLGPKTSALPTLPLRSSQVTLPIALPISLVEQVLNETAPRSQSGEADDIDDIPTISIDLTWEARRSNFRLSPETDGLRADTDIDGRVIFKGPFGSTATVDLKGTIALRTQPSLGTDWYVHPNLSGSIHLDQATHDLFNRVTVSLRGEMTPRIQRQVDEYLRRAETRIRGDDRVRQEAMSIWTTLCRDVQVSTDPEVYVQLKPVSIRASQRPRVGNESITLQLGVDVETQSAATDRDFVCPFPESLVLEGPAPGGFELVLPTEVTYETLEAVLESEFRGMTFGETVAVTIDEVGVRPYGTAVLLESTVSVKVPGWFGRRAKGTLYVVATPELDPSEERIKLTNVTLDSESEHVLTAAVGEISESWLSEAFENRTIVRLDSAYGRLRQRMNAALDQLGSADVDVQGTPVEIEVVDLDVGPEFIRVIGTVSGNVQVLWRGAVEHD